MADPGRQYRRKQFFINPRFQLLMIAFSVGLGVIVTIVLYVANLYLFQSIAGGEYAEFLQDSAMMELIEEDVSRFWTSILCAALGVFILLGFAALLISHRIAGPIYKIQKHMKEVISGSQKNECHFRENDFFPELADSYNELLRHFWKK